mmetsp:Transcript_56762/g.120764  ORF Transcript_56762/g.120764 Transcript_56762/m.120764 type:complete len:85 (-) Transcript_56762:24-278(-)
MVDSPCDPRSSQCCQPLRDCPKRLPHSSNFVDFPSFATGESAQLPRYADVTPNVILIAALQSPAQIELEFWQPKIASATGMKDC